MAHKQFTRRQKAVTLVPLALLSGAWTASLIGTSQATAVGDKVAAGTLPDGTSVPSQAIEKPANLPSAGVIAPAVPAGAADQVVDSASTTGIPSAALSAYQRAAQVIDAADKTCNIPWELIAAIGRVESDHGRYSGNVLGANGVSAPGIYGIELNGKNGTQKVQDTDAGQLDKDQVFDRAVGSMQFIPSTWQVVKVDGDGDGKRNPQDIDDASLATGVYLCSGSDDLGQDAGRRTAVFRYNHSTSYVDLVLRLMQAYMDGDYTAVPNDAAGGQVFGYSGTTAMNPIRQKALVKKHHQQQVAAGQAAGGSGSGSGTGGSVLGSGGSGSGGGTTTSGGGVVGGVVGGVTGALGGGTPKPPSTPAPVPNPVPKVLDPVTAAAQCVTKGLVDNPLSSSDAFDKCVYDLTH